MKIKKLIVGCALPALLASCYQDKGNYDYKDVNDFSIIITPATKSDENEYLVNQPGAIADTFSLTASVSQTVNSNDDNLTYTWYRIQNIDGEKEPRKDTIIGKENKMIFPAGKKSSWNITLIVRDPKADLEYYHYATVKTKTPFVDGWMFLHKDGSHNKLGILEWDVNGIASWNPDILATMGAMQFEHMTGFTYVLNGAENYLEQERMFIQSGMDSVTYIHPFSCKLMKSWNEFGLQTGTKVKQLIANSTPTGPHVGLIDGNGKFYMSTNWGVPQFSRAESPEYPTIQVAKAYINAEGKTVLWDEQNDWLVGYNESQIGNIDGIKMSQLKGKDALWIGRAANNKESGEAEDILAILKDNKSGKCYFWEVTYGDKAGIYGKATCDSLDNWGITENSKFAVSNAWNDQIFFSTDNTIWLGRPDSGEKSLVYKLKEGYTLKDMTFRICNATALNEINGPHLYYLGLLITKDGKDQLCELQLSTAADVQNEQIYELGEHTSVSQFAFIGVTRLINK